MKMDYNRELDILSIYMDYFIWKWAPKLEIISFDEFKELTYYDSTQIYKSLEQGERIPFYIYWNHIRNLKTEVL